MASEDLSARISHLQNIFAETHKMIEASKRCAGCSFLGSIAESKPGSSNKQSRSSAQVTTEIVRVQSLLAQAAKCNGVSLRNLVTSTTEMQDKATSTTSTVSSNGPQRKKFKSGVPIDCSVQTSLVEAKTASSQTDVSTDFYQDFEKYRKQFKENDAFHARWSLQQLLKFSATEREREGLETMVQFAKLFFGLDDEEFGNYYKRYLQGSGVEELRKEWIEARALKEPKPTCQRCDLKIDDDDMMDTLDDDVFIQDQDMGFDKAKITELSSQLRGAKLLIIQLLNVLEDTVEVESSTQEGVTRLLGTVSEYTEMLNGRRHSA